MTGAIWGHKLCSMEEVMDFNFAMPKNPVVALLVAPLYGAAFVLFLPFAGFVMIGLALKEWVYQIVQNRNLSRVPE